jgi:hypothetical protein
VQNPSPLAGKGVTQSKYSANAARWNTVGGQTKALPTLGIWTRFTVLIVVPAMVLSVVLILVLIVVSLRYDSTR